MSESKKVPQGPQRPKSIHAGSPAQSNDRKVPTGTRTSAAPATPEQAAYTSGSKSRSGAKIPAPTTIKPVGK